MWPITRDPSRAKSLTVLAKNSVDPGNTDGALLRLNDNVVALLEAIEVILIHGDRFKPLLLTPRGESEADRLAIPQSLEEFDTRSAQRVIILLFDF